MTKGAVTVSTGSFPRAYTHVVLSPSIKNKVLHFTSPSSSSLCPQEKLNSRKELSMPTIVTYPHPVSLKPTPAHLSSTPPPQNMSCSH